MESHAMLPPTALLGHMRREDLRRLLRLENLQLRQEGKDCRWAEDDLDPGAGSEQLAERYLRLFAAPSQPAFPFVEPESLDEIRSARPRRLGTVMHAVEGATLGDRTLGGWLGRAAGCVLGKPVEGWGRGEIRHYLTQARSYPLADYFPRLDPFSQGLRVRQGPAGICRGEIHGAPQDDDTDYTVLGLHLLETYGRALRTADVAAEWLDHLAYTRTYTAERAVYRNLVLGVPPEKAARVLNPEREYIGARIRADIFGLTCPGNPEMAAELAYRDAALSHTKNGVYSAMFLAACVAWSFVARDIDEIICVGLSQIPAECRIAEAILGVLDLHLAKEDWEAACERLTPGQSTYDPVHAINNTVWMVLALLYGQGDFETTICSAVLCGNDTDCNAANAGAVVGVMAGAQALPRRWTDPLEDTLYTAVAGFGTMRISDLARRTARLAEGNLRTKTIKE